MLELEAARDAKMLVFKQKTEKLLKQEKPVIEGLNGVIKLGETVNARFEMLGSQGTAVEEPSVVLCALLRCLLSSRIN